MIDNREQAIEKIDLLKEEINHITDLKEKRKKILTDYDNTISELKEEIKDLELKYFIVKNSYVKVIEGKKSLFGVKKIPSDLKGQVISDTTGSDVVKVKDFKTDTVYEIDIDNLVQIDWKEYYNYLYREVFERKGRMLAEFRSGDVVASRYISGKLGIIKRDFDNELVVQDRLNGASEYLSNFDWLPLYFVEDINNESLLNHKEKFLGKK